MKKIYLILLLPLLFLLSGSAFENFNFTSGSGFIFPIYIGKNLNCAGFTNAKKDDEQKFHKEFNVEEGKTLDINLNSGGSISIEGWNKNIVSADIESQRDNLDDYDITFNKTNAGIEVESDIKYGSNNNNLHFIFKVPAKFNLKIDSKGGAIKIKKVNGTISGQTMGGALDLGELKGDLDLKTMGGAIRLYDSEVDGKVHTMGGAVEITNVKGDVKGSTNGGAVVMKNVTSKPGKGSGNVITVSTMGGGIDVDEAPSGADLKTMGGGINVKSAKRFVKARTMGGSIDIENTDGAIDAETMGGDINTEMVGDPNQGDRNVTLSSKGGDITLIVPDGLSMDIDITLAFTKNHEGDYKIYSDFPINQETTADWSHKHGSARKFIYGKGKTGDGKNKIKIETINGDVYLKKG
ncbi:MAG: hypothetical protein WCE54_23115 [Ignavibacteriaceae bacterium]